MNERTQSWVLSGLVPSLAALLLSGCGGPDLSGYRPQVKTTPAVENTATADDSAVPDDAQANPESVATSAGEFDLFDQPVSALVPVNVIDGTSVTLLMRVAPPNDTTTASAIQPVSATSVIAPAAAVPATPAKPRTVELLIPEKTFQRDSSSKSLRVSYDDLDLLKVLNLEPVTDNAVELMPTWLRELNGQRIRIRGFMYPTFEAEGIERFVLARDNQICCFGRDPKVYDLVQVDLKAGSTTNYIPATRAFDVIGRFRIEMSSEDGKPFGLYYIQDAQIVDR